MYGHPSSSAVDRSAPTSSQSRHTRTQSQYGGMPLPPAPAPEPRRTGSGHEYRRSVIPPHLQNHGSSWNNNGGAGGAGSRGHAKRGSVVDIAADFLGPAATENLERVRQQSSKLEDKIDGWTRPVRPYLPGVGRFLIVVTFLEDALRILTQITGTSPARAKPSLPHGDQLG